jgi:hypothetical protein
VPKRLDEKPASAAAITTATATRITVAITGEMPFFVLFFGLNVLLDITGHSYRE